MENRDIKRKYENLKDHIKSLKNVAVAFSGGVDSTFLLYAAHEAIGDDVIAVTARSYLFPKDEMAEAGEFCKKQGIRQEVLTPMPLEIEGFAENPKDRCYFCKREVFKLIKETAKGKGIIHVAEGSNMDDNSDYRPGHRAIEELGILSPLRECGFYKDEIRELSKQFGLPTWDKPSFACLASRIPYGETITEAKLSMVENAEKLLFGMGFKQLRVRCHKDMARIELLPKDMERFMKDDIRIKVHEELKKLGFFYVALDLMGYRTGSMNETILK